MFEQTNSFKYNLTWPLLLKTKNVLTSLGRKSIIINFRQKQIYLDIVTIYISLRLFSKYADLKYYSTSSFNCRELWQVLIQIPYYYYYYLFPSI